MTTPSETAMNQMAPWRCSARVSARRTFQASRLCHVLYVCDYLALRCIEKRLGCSRAGGERVGLTVFAGIMAIALTATALRTERESHAAADAGDPPKDPG